MRKLLIVLLLLYSAASPADEAARLKEANFPALAQADTTPMERKGQIVLTYLWADIYAAALFTPPGISPEQAFNEQRDLRLELFYLRDLDHSDITQASATILKRQHPATTLASLDAPLKKLQASFGISVYPEDGADVATLVKNADAAMYRSKLKGRNRVERYTHDLSAQASVRVVLEQELRRALERGQLSLFYQPKISLHDLQLIGAEALIRWHHPTLGEISPDRFIVLAEENGMIIPIGDWVLEHACQQMHLWNQTYEPFGPVSVNLAGAQLHQPKLLGRIQQLLRTYDLKPGCLQLEITENSIMSQTEEALEALHQLKHLGVQLAIDDFGTGYSSLSYLKRLPLDTLKIDKSFIRGLPDDPHDAAIVRAIIALGRSMQFSIIAEGVETQAQQTFLAAEGCEQIQGYLISVPLSATEFAETFLRTSI